MPNKFISAVKENKNNIRKNIIIGAGITVGVIAVAVVLTKVKSNADLALVPTDAVDALVDAVPAE